MKMLIACVTVIIALISGTVFARHSFGGPTGVGSLPLGYDSMSTSSQPELPGHHKIPHGLNGKNEAYKHHKIKDDYNG